MGIRPNKSQYRQVADVLRERIESGQYPRGSAIPTEDELAEEMEVSRPVVSRAIAVLRAEGLLRAKHLGKGSIVNEIPTITRDGTGRQRADVREQGRGAFDGELRRLGLTPRSDLVRVGQTEAPAEAAEALGIETGASVLERHRVMYANDVPVQVATSYVPWDIAGGTPLTEVDTGPGGLYSRLADLGHRPTEYTEVIDVRPPTDDEATVLHMEADQRVYVITRTAKTAEGRTVETCIHVMPAHQWRLTYTWSAD